MGNKEQLHELKITTYVAPISADTQAKARATNAVDTKNYESNMMVLDLGVVASDVDWTVQMYESDVSVTDAGTACGVADVMVAVSDNNQTQLDKFSAARLLTLTAAADGGKQYLFAYKGAKRWMRLVVTSAGPKACVAAIYAVQGHFRYMGRDGLHLPD